MSDRPPRLLILGAHPDDAEFHAGGLAVRAAAAGHVVRIISVTDGSSGHHQLDGPALALRRSQEAAAAGRLVGAEYLTWPHPDGRLQATLAVREQVIAEIRTFQPDLVLTHRPCDYHPDHRAVGQLVQDASYLVTVPRIVPDVPVLRRDPVVAYMPDLFTRPNPLRPDVVLDVEPEVDTVCRMLACHRSQVFEWLPFNQQIEDQVPEDEALRLAWLRDWFGQQVQPRAERFREALRAAFGTQRGSAIRWMEAYEISEYAAPLTPARRQRLFPGAPSAGGS